MRAHVRMLSLTCALVIGLGCADERVGVVHLSSDDVDAARERTSPENVLENLALAYRLQDIDLYRSQLAPTYAVSFPVAFAEAGGPASFSLDQDVASTRNMFASSDGIRFEMIYDRPVPSTHPEFPASDGYVEAHVHDLDLACGRDTVRMWVEDGQCDFVFQRDPAAVDLWLLAHQYLRD